MLDSNIIRPSISDQAALIVPVFVFTTSVRTVSRRKTWSLLPRIDQTLDSLDSARYFATLDLASGYWQVELHPWGLYEFPMIPFRLTNASTTFQRSSIWSFKCCSLQMLGMPGRCRHSWANVWRTPIQLTPGAHTCPRNMSQTKGLQVSFPLVKGPFSRSHYLEWGSSMWPRKGRAGTFMLYAYLLRGYVQLPGSLRTAAASS